MPANLTGSRPKDTYTGLLHLAGPGPLSSTPRIIVLGDGTATPLAVTDSGITINSVAPVLVSGNQTIAGAKTFSGQMELTGQAATNATSAMTRALGDARYGSNIVITADIASQTTLPSYDNVGDLTLPVGTYEVLASYNCTTTAASGTIQMRSNFFTVSGTIAFWGRRVAAGNQASILAYPLQGVNTANNDTAVTVGSPNFTFGVLEFVGHIIVTADAVVRFRFSHNAAPGANTTGKFICRARKIA